MECISCPEDDSGLPFPLPPLRAGIDGLSKPLSGALLPSGASVTLMAKLCLGCPSISPTLDATGLCCPQGWEYSQKDPPGCSWPERDLEDNTFSLCDLQPAWNKLL